ncbi:MAG TPA: hydrogenase maturation protease [Vicinamibacterales bacterium]|jgi:hydrogenase maturation protease|nr:hydrogenase maturation protease [Vicinamibacterales bacterium]
MDVRIIGIGNVLMGDDGFGPYVVKTLEALYEFPADVSVIDAGTPGLDLSPYLMNADVVIFVDAVKASGDAGFVQTYGREDLMRPGVMPRLGPHDPALAQTLTTLDLAGKGPKAVLLVGAISEQARRGPGLTVAMRSAVPDAVERVVNMLAVLGLPPIVRPIPLEPDVWWERKPASTLH